MSREKLSRRRFLKGFAVAAGTTAMAACAPKIVKETVVVNEEKVVEKVVKETVIVEGTPQVVEKVITAQPVMKEPVTLRAMERLGAPALEPSAPFVGGFVGTTWGYRIESREGDALCLGTPTEIVFLSNVSEGTAVGRTTVDAAIVHDEGQGVVAMIETPEGRWVLLAWPGGRRLVTVEGETIADIPLPLPEDCDCC